jgi:hypothetical protein
MSEVQLLPDLFSVPPISGHNKVVDPHANVPAANRFPGEIFDVETGLIDKIMECPASAGPHRPRNRCRAQLLLRPREHQLRCHAWLLLHRVSYHVRLPRACVLRRQLAFRSSLRLIRSTASSPLPPRSAPFCAMMCQTRILLRPRGTGSCHRRCRLPKQNHRQHQRRLRLPRGFLHQALFHLQNKFDHTQDYKLYVNRRYILVVWFAMVVLLLLMTAGV